MVARRTPKSKGAKMAKLDTLKTAAAAGDWQTAFSIAARFPRLGAHRSSDRATTASLLGSARLPGLPFTSFNAVGVGFLPAAIYAHSASYHGCGRLKPSITRSGRNAGGRSIDGSHVASASSCTVP